MNGAHTQSRNRDDRGENRQLRPCTPSSPATTPSSELPSQHAGRSKGLTSRPGNIEATRIVIPRCCSRASESVWVVRPSTLPTAPMASASLSNGSVSQVLGLLDGHERCALLALFDRRRPAVRQGSGRPCGHALPETSLRARTLHKPLSAQQKARANETRTTTRPCGHATPLYNLACCEVLAGRKEDAIGHLRVAFERRPSLRDVAKEDTDLDPLRDEPAFRELVD
jgi:hypothetical protein